MFSTAIQRLNDRRSAEGEAGADAGFTLIELMVVLLILAILLAIAIPTFLGVTKSANDRAAQSNLNTALLNAKAQYQNNSQAYPATAALVTALTSAEPSLSFQAGASADQNHISVYVSTDTNALVLAAFSKATSNCWMVVDTPVQTAVLTPFAAAQTPTVAVDTTLGPQAGAANVLFSTTQLGPTYAEVKTTTTGQCVASAPTVPIGASYRYSFTAFPSI
jgi:type IV pilus assembly protein PilA